jgi:hypothetical protein
MHQDGQPQVGDSPEVRGVMFTTPGGKPAASRRRVGSRKIVPVFLQWPNSERKGLDHRMDHCR